VFRPESVWFLYVAETDTESSCAQSTFYARTERQYPQKNLLFQDKFVVNQETFSEGATLAKKLDVSSSTLT